MYTNNSNYGCNCVGLAVISSISLAIIAAVLRYIAIITVTPAFLWVIFGIAVAYLAVILLTTAFSKGIVFKTCVCNIITPLIIGVLGTILTSVILLAIAFAATSIIGAIITGAAIFFFSLMLITIACLIRCLAQCVND